MTPPGAIQRRDAALRRLIRVRTGAAVGAAGLTAALGALIADTAPGRAADASSSTKASTHTVAAQPLPALESARQLGLRPAPRHTVTPAASSTNATTTSAPVTTSGQTTNPAQATTSPATTNAAPAAQTTQPLPPPPAPSPVVTRTS